MAIVEETIGSGKDRATIALWEANVGVFGTDTYKGIIQEDAEFNENVTLTGSTGTPSITSYLWLTTDPANRHAGVAGTGHGRMRGSSGGTHVINVATNFTRIDWLEIQQDSNGASDEGIRVLVGADDVLVDYCIIWTDNTAGSMDGVYTGSYAVADLRISNCIIYGWNRGGLHCQQFGSTARTISWEIDHCSIYDCGADLSNEVGALHVDSSAASDVITIGLSNTWGHITGTDDEPFADTGDTGARGVPDGAVTWNGSHNLATVFTTHDEIDGTDNITNWQHASDSPYVEETTQSSGNFVVVTEKGPGSEDVTLLDTAAGNLAAGNGTNRQGSEPDARQDFSVAIDGFRRTTVVDIGASAIQPIVQVGTTQSAGNSDGNDVTLTFDVAPIEDDFVFVTGGNPLDSGSLVGPSTAGYTEDSLHQPGSTFSHGFWYKKMGATPDTDVVCQGTGSGVHSAAYNAIVLRGVDPGTPIDAATVKTGPTTSADPDLDAIVTITDAAWVILTAGGESAEGGIVHPTGYVGVFAIGVDTVRHVSAMSTKQPLSVGSEDPDAYTLWSSMDWIGFTIAIRPDGGMPAASPPSFRVIQDRRRTTIRM